MVQSSQKCDYVPEAANEGFRSVLRDGRSGSRGENCLSLGLDQVLNLLLIFGAEGAAKNF